MGKPKGKRGHGRKKINPKDTTEHDDEVAKPVKSEAHDKYKIENLLEKAEDSINTFNYEVAQRFCQRALEMEPDNVQALELTAGLLLEVGEFEKAKQCLGRAIFVEPDVGYTKYLTLGQLHNGVEALQYYRKGTEILKLLIEDESSEGASAKEKENNVDLVHTLSTACCAIAELFMTDCCFEAVAESQCLHNLELAIKVDPSNFEAYQIFASYYLVQENKEKALEMIKKSLSLWLPQYQAVREGRAETADAVEVCPVSYDLRLSAVKLLIELGEYDDGASILEGLVEEDDEVVEVWYLLGWMNHLKGEEFKSNARYYFQKCIKVAKKAEVVEEEMMNHVSELLEELGSGDEEEEDDDEEEEEEDDEEDENKENSAEIVDEPSSGDEKMDTVE